MADVTITLKFVSEPYIPYGKSMVAILKSFNVMYSEEKNHNTTQTQRAVYTSFTKMHELHTASILNVNKTHCVNEY